MSAPAPTAPEQGLTLRIERTAEGWRWEMRRDYADTCTSGNSARIADVFGVLLRICQEIP